MSVDRGPRRERVPADSLGCFERRGMIQNAAGEGRGFSSEGKAPRLWALRPGQGFRNLTGQRTTGTTATRQRERSLGDLRCHGAEACSEAPPGLGATAPGDEELCGAHRVRASWMCTGTDEETASEKRNCPRGHRGLAGLPEGGTDCLARALTHSRCSVNTAWQMTDQPP